MSKRNKRGMGSVRWREDTGKYVIDYYDNLGKRHVETVGTNKHQGIDMLTEKMHQINTGTYTPPSQGRTFKEFVEGWLNGKVGVKDRTKISYEGIVKNHLLPYFGQARISDLKRDNIRDLVKAKVDENRLSPKTIHNILLVLHQILDDAQVEGLVLHNPYVKIEKPKRERPEVDFLRTHEIRTFLKACEAVKEPEKKISGISEKKKEKLPKCETTRYALFYTAIFSGMRRGELLGLKWADIEWLNQKIHVKRSLYKNTFQTPKSEYSKRAIDMGPRLIQVLKEHRIKQNETRLKVGSGWSDSDLVFCQNNGTPLDGDNLYHRDLRGILKKAGLRAIRIHDLRHTFASILISAGHNLKYIQTQMGHSSVKITLDLYAHLMPEVYEGAAKKSEDFVFSKVSGNVMVTENEKGVTTESQPLDSLGSGGKI
jgi:integrase